MLEHVLAVFRAWRTRSRDAIPKIFEQENGSALDHGKAEQIIKGGSGNLQVGVAHGDVVSSVCHHTHNFTVIQTLPSTPGGQSRPSSTEQSAVLKRMDQLRDRVPVLDFMVSALLTTPLHSGAR